MTRLLFAAARGARIEIRVFNEYSWRNAYNLDLNKGSAASDWVYRIHPDDEHLQYGPISTALREMAEYYSWNPSWEHRVAHAAADDFAVKFHGEPDYPLYYLILAEFLADEGM